jgi:hypothetical protein
MAQDVERLKKLKQLVAEQESLIRRMIERGTPNPPDQSCFRASQLPAIADEIAAMYKSSRVRAVIEQTDV